MHDIERTKNKIGTNFISECLGREHHSVKNMVRKYKDFFKNISSITSQKTPTKGRPHEEYFLTEIQFLFLSSLFKNNDQIIELKAHLCETIEQTILTINKINSALNNFDFDGIQDRYVYVAEDASGNLKIGISNDPERRLSELNQGNPDELRLIYTKKADGKGYQDEIFLHEKCKDYRIRGEWFKKEAKELL